MDFKKTRIVALAFAGIVSIYSHADERGSAPQQYDDQGPVEEQGPPPPPPIGIRPQLPPVYAAPQPVQCEAFYYGGPFFGNLVPPYCPITQYSAPNQVALVPCELFSFQQPLYPNPLPPYCGAFGQPGFPAPAPVVIGPVPYTGYGFSGGGVVVNPGFRGGFNRGFVGGGVIGRPFVGGGVVGRPFVGGGAIGRGGFGGVRRGRISVANSCSIEKNANGNWVVKNAIGEVKFTSPLRNNDGEAAAKAQKLQLEKAAECKLPSSNDANKTYDI